MSESPAGQRPLVVLPKPAGRKGPPTPSAASLCREPVDIRSKLTPKWVRPVAFGGWGRGGPVQQVGVASQPAGKPAKFDGAAAEVAVDSREAPIETAIDEVTGLAPATVTETASSLEAGHAAPAQRAARPAPAVSVRTGGSSRRFVSVRLPSRLVRAFLNRPPMARLLFVAAVGAFAVAGAVIVARNKLEAASRPPIARVMNPALAEQRLKLTRARADLIHRVVGMYAAQHGAPPERLEALVPEFLPGIPQPLNGATEWSYRVEADGSGWSIGFRSWSSMRPELREERIRAGGAWAMVDGE